MALDRSIEYCKGVGTKRADILLSEIGVRTARDMLYYFPYKYIDRSRFYYIRDIPDDDTYVQIIGTITEWHTLGIGKKQRVSATFSDGRDTVELVWFQQGIKYLKLEYGVKYLLFGKPSYFNHSYNFPHPELTPWNKVTPNMTDGLEPSYPLTEKMKNVGLNNKALRGIMAGLLPEIEQGIEETIGESVLTQYHLMGLTESLIHIHFPKDKTTLQRARERLKFEELFYIQLQILKQMKRREQVTGYMMPVVGKNFMYFYHHCLPFEMTGAQKRVMHEIQTDLKSGKQMNRLLQGDVGSGKTLVALLAALLAVDNGYQACIMAPTEILASQHLQTLRALLKDTPVHVELLTGSTTKKQRELILDGLKYGEVQIMVGTHALIEDTVQFANLGLCIIDEQHRFGVVQRAKLWNKNIQPPHVLVMTATPIPRTLAMTFYGDLQVSKIDELPPGRKPVHTIHYGLQFKNSVHSFMEQQIAAGRQIYVVFPLIQENEKLALKDLENGYKELCDTFPQYHISMVHGKMKSRDKELQMQSFQRGETQILVATTVIEVGVNVPNATVMIVENAERFGLSQLHQLRGRVGRGADQSYCVLLTNSEVSKDTRTRMDIMVATNDGFRIAEADLQLRGPGDMDGTQQSGLPFDLHIANLSTDGQIVEIARRAAMDILDKDPMLVSEWNGIYRCRLDQLQLHTQNWSEIS